MGNCINLSSSSAGATDRAQADAKPAERSACDERTVETSSHGTISPPASPVKPEPPGDKQDADAAQATEKVPPEPSSVEQQREEGQRRLRELVITGANQGEIDWKSIIALAEDLHRREQQLLKSYNENRPGSKAGGKSRQNISRRQAFFEKRRRRREASRRKKLESAGSFSVNLLTYDADERRKQQHKGDESRQIQQDERDTSTSSTEQENAVDDSEEQLDIFEDDESPLHHDCSTSPTRTRRGTERPDTPSTFTKPSPAGVVVAVEGSFLAATSLFGSPAKGDDCSDSCSSSDSSTSSASRGKNWDLMTIDEDATVTDWR